MLYLIAFLYALDAMFTSPSMVLTFFILFLSEDSPKTEAWVVKYLNKGVHYVISLIFWVAVGFFIYV